MSSSIDQRIVEMQFNNQQFEAAVSQTMSSLDSLKNSLNVLSSAEALENLTDVDPSGLRTLSDEVDKSSSKFSALQEIAVGALRKIGEMAIEAGTQLARNLGNTLIFDNINAGWQKYADKSESVQTIMAATREELAASGNQMEIVNEELEKLNWFTDETSFNFTDMTSNIGKFTSAGVGLEDSTKAMMGISTWAAASGANINQASHAMYNLSQAMGVGVVTLADWKSIENANMATIEFKKTALETAVAEGTLIKVNEDLYKTLDGTEVTVTNFRETLTEDKWLNSNVLIKTLDKYGSYASKLADGQSELNDLTDNYYETTSKLLKDVDRYIDGTLDLNAISKETGASVADLTEQFDLLSKSEDDLGRRAFRAAQEATTFQQAIDAVKDAASTTWMNIFEDVFGDYEHAKVLWTDLSNALWDTFVGPLSNLEEVVGSWSEQGGNAFAIEGVINLWEAFASVIGAVGEALGELFPPLTAERLVDLTRSFRDFTANLKPSEETLERIKNVVLGLVSPFKFLFGAVKRVITAGFPPLISLGGRIVSLFIRLAGTVGGAVASAFVNVGEKVGKIFTALNNVKVVMFSQLSDPLKRISAAISRIFDSIITKVKGLDIFKKLGEKVTGFTDLIVKSISKWGFDNWKLGSFKNFGDLIASIFEKAADAVEKYDLNGKVNSIVTYLGNAFKKLKGYFNQAKDYITNIDIVGKLTTAFEYIKNAYYQAKDSVKEYIDSHEGLKSVVDWFTSIKEKVQASVEDYGILGTIVGAVGIAVDSIVNSLTSLYTYLQSSGVFTAIGNGFLAAYNNVVAFGTYIYDSLSPFVTAAYEDIKKFFEGFKGKSFGEIIESFKKWKDSIKGPKDLLDSLKKTFSNLTKEIKEFFGKTKPEEETPSTFEKIKESIKGVVDWLKELFANKNAVDLFKYVLSVIAAIAAIKFTFSISNLSNSLSGLLDIFKKQKKDSFGKVVIEIAVALAILAGSLWVLAQIPSDRIEDVSGTMATLFGLLAGLGGLMMAMQKYFGSDMVKVGGGMLMLAGSIAIMLYVVKLIANSGITFDTVKENIESFIVVFGSLGVLLLMTKLAGKNAQKGGQGVLLISVALAVIIGVIKMIAKMDPNDVEKGKKVVEELLVVFGIVMMMSKLAGEHANEAGKMFLKMSVAIGILSICIAALGNMNPETVKKGMRAIEEMMAVFSIVMLLSGFAKGGSAKTIGAMTTAIVAITVALVALTFFDGDAVLESAKSLSLVLAVLAVAFLTLSKSEGKFGKMLGTAITMGLVISEITGALILLNTFGGEHTIRNAIALDAVMAVLFICFKQMSKITATTKKMRSTAGTMAIVLGSIAVALGILGKFGGDNIIQNAIALSGVLAVLIEVFKKFKPINATIGQAAVTAGLMVVALGSVVAALILLNQFGGNKTIQNATALSEALVFVALSVGILSKTNMNILEAVACAIAIVALLGTITGALILLNEFGGDKVLENATALSELALALSVSIGIFSLIGAGGAIAGAIGAVGGIAIFLGGITGILDLLGIWATSQKSNIEAGLEMAQTIATGIGEFIGNIVKAVGDTVFSSLPGWGQDITDFANNLQGFITVFSGVPNGFGEKVGAVASAIFELTKSELVDNLAGWLGKITGGNTSLADFGEDLDSFGGSFASFVKKMSGVTIDDAVNASVAMAQSMVELSKDIDADKGIIQFLFGDKIDEFGVRLVKFGFYFKNFVETITGISDYQAAVKACESATKVMLALQAESLDMTADKGLWQLIWGDKLDEFGKRMKKFADYFNDFVTTITGIEESDYQGAVNACANATKVMLALQSESLDMTSDKGFWQLLFGDKLDTFGQRMNKFANYFKQFVANITGIENSDYEDAVSSCAAVTKVMLALQNTTLDTDRGFLKHIFGDDLDDFGGRMASFGASFNLFANSIDGVPDVSDKIENVKNIASVLAEFANTEIDKDGGLIGFFEGSQYKGLENFGTGIKAFGEGLAGYSTAIQDLDFDAIQTSFGLFQQIIDIANVATTTETQSMVSIINGMSSIAQQAIAAFTAGLTNEASNTENFGTALETMFRHFVAAAETQKALILTQDGSGYIPVTLGPTIISSIDESLPEDDVKAIAIRVIENLETGIDEEDDNLFDAAETMAETVDETVRNILYDGVWFDVGLNAAQGLASGIAAGTESAVNAARALAMAVEEAASVTLQVNSPSKVFIGIGQHVVEGFVKGITDNTTGAKSSIGRNFASLAAHIADTIDGDIDHSPVITPVLDLTNLERGSAAMDSMFGQRNLSGYAVTGPENVNIQDDAINRLVMGMDKFINRAQNEPQPPINIYVTGGNNADANEIADVVMDKLNVELHRRRAAMA